MLLYCGEKTSLEEPRRLQDGEVGWVYWVSPDPSEVEYTLASVFGCHPLAVEDVQHFGQRPKVDEYMTHTTPHVFMSFYSLQSGLHEVEVAIVLGERFIVTAVREEIPLLRDLYQKVQMHTEMMSSPGALLYQILDACADTYLTVADELEVRVLKVEQMVIDQPEEKIAHEILRLKRRLQRVRRLIADGRSVVTLLMRESFPYTDRRQMVYFEDIRDHITRALDELDALRDHVGSLLDLQSAQRSNRMNSIMMTLTILSTIFLPLNFIVGLYGMNFKDIPELSWRFGYVYVWALMLSVTAVSMVYFKRKGWW